MAELGPVTLVSNVPLPNTRLTVTVHTKLTRLFHIRLWLGTQLIRLAALFLGCDVVFEGIKEVE